MARFAFKVTEVFEFKDSIAVIGDRAKAVAPKGKAGLELRKPDGSVLKAVPVPVKFRYDPDAPSERPVSIHFRKVDADNNCISKFDVPIGTEVWYCAEWQTIQGKENSKRRLREVI
jgi:hypothetical protein